MREGGREGGSEREGGANLSNLAALVVDDVCCEQKTG